jgi:hypothetical protein
MTLQVRARFVADAVYGQTGTGKTFQIAKAAERLWRVRRKKTRYIGGDSGGFDTLGDLVQYHSDGSVDVEHSVVLPFVLAGDPHPIETMDRLAQGYWPNKDGVLSLGPFPQDVGQYAIEGLTSIGDLMMRHLSATKTRLSQDPAYTYKDGVTEFSGTNMSYYGEVQNRIYDIVVKSSILPVEKVIWTALEGRGEEDGTKAPTFGPSIVGKKSTGKAGQWFGNMVHMEMLVDEKPDPGTKQLNRIEKRLMYVQPHADLVTKIPFPAKVRVPFNTIDQFAKALGGQPYMDPPDLGKLYDLLESLRQPKEATNAAQ